MTSLFAAPKKATYTTVPTAPVEETTTIDDTDEKRREAEARKTNRAATILTSGLGVPTGTAKAATLLGN